MSAPWSWKFSSQIISVLCPMQCFMCFFKVYVLFLGAYYYCDGQKQFWGGSFILLIAHCPSWGEVTEETEAESVEWQHLLFSMTFSTCSHIPPKTTSPGWYHILLAGPFPINCQSRKCPTDSLAGKLKVHIWGSRHILNWA